MKGTNDMNSKRIVIIGVGKGISGGVARRFGKEGFEVKSPKRTVQIFTQADRVPGGDPSVKMMIPVSAKIDGKSTDVTRNNLRAVAAELIAALRNQ